MNKSELNKLVEKAESHFDANLVVIDKDYSGKRYQKTYKLVDVKPIGVGKIRDAYTEPAEDDMWYTVFAIIQGENERERLDIFPLKMVIEAIEEGKPLARDFFDN